MELAIAATLLAILIAIAAAPREPEEENGHTRAAPRELDWY